MGNKLSRAPHETHITTNTTQYVSDSSLNNNMPMNQGLGPSSSSSSSNTTTTTTTTTVVGEASGLSASTMEPKPLGVLQFRVVEARITMEKDLKMINGQEVASVAPFIVINFENKAYETRVVEKVHPIWNQNFHILLHNYSMNEQIILDVMNMCSYTRYQKLGSLKITLKEFLTDYQAHEVWVNVHTKVKRHRVGPRKIKVPIADIHIRYQLVPMAEVSEKFWVHLAKQYDFDKNGSIDSFEMTCLLQAIGSTLDDQQVKELISTGPIPISQLPVTMSRSKEKHLVRITHCPVCGDRISDKTTQTRLHTVGISGVVYTAELKTVQRFDEDSYCRENEEVIAHVQYCMEEHGDEDILVRNFLVDIVGISWWKDGLPEWRNFNSNMRDSGNIVIFDRQRNELMQEKIPVFAKMAMRAVYTSLEYQRPNDAKEFLSKLTQIVGNKYKDPKSRKYIPEFIRFFGIDVDEILDPVSSFLSFNDFFSRKLKPHSRPIAEIRNQHIAVCPADCRIVGYENVGLCARFWAKGKGFTVSELLHDPDLTARFNEGSVAVCRLGPMDPHRFYFPTGCKVGRTYSIDGDFLVDNPVCIREDVDVYTTNKRTVTMLEETEFGLVVMVCIGSTMVGSVALTSKHGHHVKKGDEHGFFQFGGSTIILVFEPNRIVFAEDILRNSQTSIETFCRLGSPLGVPA
eukprot:TRINITY_DN1326_c0_g5_i1.p1 TRINITY_DN1326_c0_g5~~TRINITY_DN1326_c0_g5_i1.p1  ORF type:complete len:687 (+),score=132.03 TRINITY_DN1326_c0_g5_i1:88-2148(+)